MNSIKKITAAVVSAVAMLTAVSGSFVSAADAGNTVVYERYDMSRLDNLLADFEAQLTVDDNTEEVIRFYNLIVDEVDYIESQFSLAMVKYSENMSDENLSEYRYMDDIGVLGMSRITQSFRRALKSDYKKIIAELIGSATSSAISSGDISTDKETEEFLNRKNALEQEYISVSYSSVSADRKDLECAGIYLDLVKLLNSIVISEDHTYFDYVYYTYGRDYTADDIAAISDTARESVVESYKLLRERLSAFTGVFNKDIIFDRNFDIVSQYSYRISDELLESARTVNKNDLYFTGSGSDSEKKAYTIPLPYYDSAAIYQYLYSNTHDMTSAVHEFGHFNAMRLNKIHSMYKKNNNLDIAETQSQGLEVMYTAFYNEIYGPGAERYRISAAMDLLSAIAGGLMGNEFEQYVFENADSMTPEDVLSKYKEIMGKYEIYSNHLSDIAHFFQMPGYYISYAVSALAVFDLWNVMYRDFDRAAEMYTEFSHVPNDGSTGFAEALRMTGFDDVFSSDFISEKIPAFSALLASGQIYGDADGNGILNSSDMLYLIRKSADILSGISEEEILRCDLNEDSVISIADVLIMKRLLF